MNKQIDSVLQRYWSNEAEIATLEKEAGVGIDAIVDNPAGFTSDVISKLKSLLFTKKRLLSILGSLERESIVNSPIVNLSMYRRFASFRSARND